MNKHRRSEGGQRGWMEMVLDANAEVNALAPLQHYRLHEHML